MTSSHDGGGRASALLLLILLAIPITLYAMGVFDVDIVALRAVVAGVGAAAPVLWVVVQSALEGGGVPSTVPVLAAMVLWPPEQALVVCVLGSAGGFVVGFWVARVFAREWVQSKLPPRARDYEARLSQRPFLAAFIARMVLFVAPGPAWLFGLSSARFAPAALGALLGCAPGLYLTVFHGPALVAWTATLTPAHWAALGAAASLTVVAVWWRRRRAPASV